METAGDCLNKVFVAVSVLDDDDDDDDDNDE